METITLDFELQQMKNAVKYIINYKNFWHGHFFSTVSMKSKPEKNLWQNLNT